MARAALLILLAALPCLAENYLLNGGQSSEIRYVMTQEVVPQGGLEKLTLSYVVPKDFTSPTYSQAVSRFAVRYSRPPAGTRRSVDGHGNEVVFADWFNPAEPVQVRLEFSAVTRTSLRPVDAAAGFPPAPIPVEARPYLEPTPLIPSRHPDFVAKARSLTRGAATEFEAVQRILAWIVDRITYVQHPEQYDAVWSLRTGKGNCQNYSHLAAALMRAVGIPVRIVNGVTLKQPYEVRLPNGVMAMRMAQGRHSWIEVFFPGLGWTPFDPQQTELFVSNRFLRVEIGTDNEETVNDGNVRFKRRPGSLQMPMFQEVIAAEFTRDQVSLTGERMAWGPRRLLFSPPLASAYSGSSRVMEQAEAPAASFSPSAGASYDKPDTLGNLDFPENLDFLGARTLEDQGGGEFSLRKNFLVETAEYVTGRGERYAQSFELDRPMALERVGLALHRFGGTGDLWVELARDDGSGRPGGLLETSELVPSSSVSGRPGYAWHDFRFARSGPVLEPGRYWIVLAYSGSPVVNWFFSYGKNAGPSDGTRFNVMFDETWSRSLSYEFNFRLIGSSSR